MSVVNTEAAFNLATVGGPDLDLFLFEDICVQLLLSKYIVKLTTCQHMILRIVNQGFSFPAHMQLNQVEAWHSNACRPHRAGTA